MDSGISDPLTAEQLVRSPKLLDRMRVHLRTRHYSMRTEQSYVDWARRYILYHNKRHPRGMSVREVKQFLTYLAVGRRVSASTQNQAKSALLYLYRQVLEIDLPWLDEVVQARRPKRLPVVLTPSEVRDLLQHMSGTPGLVAELFARAVVGARRLHEQDFAADYGRMYLPDVLKMKTLGAYRALAW